MATSREALADVLTDLGLKGPAAAVEAGGSVPSDAVDAIRREVVDLAARLELPSGAAPAKEKDVAALCGELQALRMLAARQEESASASSPESEALGALTKMLGVSTLREANEKLASAPLPSPAAPPASGTAPRPPSRPRILDASKLRPEDMRALSQLNKALRADYRSRRQMLLHRLDVTLQSFLWSEKGAEAKAEIESHIAPLRAALQAEPAHVSVDTLLAAGPEALDAAEARVTSAGSGLTEAPVAKSVVIGAVPDRGGRCGERRPSAADLGWGAQAGQSRSWQKRSSDQGGVGQPRKGGGAKGGGGKGGGGGRRGRGGGRRGSKGR
jgi:hypothetical protein